jgi:secretion/DNA translocation related TadE-like protein
VGAIAVLCVIFGALLAMGQAVVIRHRAAGAADLAALAAADHWAEGTDAACATAKRLARAQGTRLVRCVIRGDTSDVTVVSGRGLPASLDPARPRTIQPRPHDPAPQPQVRPLGDLRGRSLSEPRVWFLLVRHESPVVAGVSVRC